MSTDATWKAGDRGVCVKEFTNPSFTHNNPPTFGPKKGVIYLVDSTLNHERGTFLFLCGVVSPVTHKLAGWHVGHFRKVVPACDRAAVGRENQSLSE